MSGGFACTMPRGGLVSSFHMFSATSCGMLLLEHPMSGHLFFTLWVAWWKEPLALKHHLQQSVFQPAAQLACRL